VLVHRDELVRQAVDKLGYAGIASIGVVKAEHNAINAQVVVASVQTLSRPTRLAQLAQDFRTIVVDEGHHATARTYQRILTHVGAGQGNLLLGVTATPFRADGAELSDVFERIVYECSILDMIERGYLCQLRAIEVQTRVDYTKLKTGRSESGFHDQQAGELLLAADAPEDIVNAYQTYAPGRRSLVFTPTVAVAETVVVAFKEAGVPAALIFNGTPTEERRTTLAHLRAGAIRVVANCTVLTEGFDEPLIEAVVIARPIRSKLLYTQIIGRGTRRHPHKTDCLILDMVGAVRRNDLLTASALFGATSPEAVTALATKGVVAATLEQQEADALAGRLEAEQVELFRQQAAAFANRQMRWVTVDRNHYAMTLDKNRRIHLLAQRSLVLNSQNGFDPVERWDVLVTTAAPKFDRHRSYLKRPAGRQVVASGLALGYAQGFAEDYVRKHGTPAFSQADAAWIDKPASDKAIQFATRLGEQPRDRATAAEVSGLITRALARREIKPVRPVKVTKLAGQNRKACRPPKSPPEPDSAKPTTHSDSRSSSERLA
jgi:superfamily II DNA or RNA helicase